MRSISQGILNYVSSMRTTKQVHHIQPVPYIALLMLFVLCLPAFADPTYDFSGITLSISDPNGLYVDVTQPGTTGLKGNVEVLLEKPMPDLYYFAGIELQFDILGHDILGRPVCDAYFAGSPIQDLYYCREYPDLCAFYGPDFENRLYNWDRLPILPAPPAR